MRFLGCDKKKRWDKGEQRSYPYTCWNCAESGTYTGTGTYWDHGVSTHKFILDNPFDCPACFTTIREIITPCGDYILELRDELPEQVSRPGKTKKR